MSPYLLVLFAIIIICIQESKRKSSQPIFTRLKLASFQIICTISLMLVTLLFFSNVLNASSTQIEIVGAIVGVISTLTCAYIFRRK